MTDSLTAHDENTEVTTKEQAAVLAYDTLADAGCESIVTSMPHRTRSTWIVPATCDESSWRVHIDPSTGKTRIVETAD